MANIQVPPAAGSSGQLLDAVVSNVASTTLRQVIVIGDPTSTANQLGINASGQITVAQAATVRSLSSGTVTVTSGVITLSSATSLSSGTVTLSSNPTVISASSGLIQLTSAIALSSGIVTLSSPTSLSSGTVTLSSNPTVINASSGNIGTMPSTSVTLSIFNFTASSSASIQGVAAGAHTIYGWNFGSQVAGAQVCVRVYNTTGPTVGSTTSLLFAIPIPGSTAGAGNNYTFPGPGINSTGGIGFVLVDSFITTSTALGTHNAGEVVGQLYYV